MLVIMTMAVFYLAFLSDIATNRNNPMCCNVTQGRQSNYSLSKWDLIAGLINLKNQNRELCLKHFFTLAMFAAKMLIIMTMAIFSSASLGDIATNRSNPM